MFIFPLFLLEANMKHPGTVSLFHSQSSSDVYGADLLGVGGGELSSKSVWLFDVDAEGQAACGRNLSTHRGRQVEGSGLGVHAQGRQADVEWKGRGEGVDTHPISVLWPSEGLLPRWPAGTTCPHEGSGVSLWRP